MPPRRLPPLGLLFLLLVTLACSMATTSGLTGTDPILVPPSPTANSIPQPTPPQDRWEQLTSGIEWRGAAVITRREDTEFEVPVTMLRLDLSRVTIRAHYTPDEPAAISTWQERFASAAVITNGGFFLADGQARGILVCDGIYYNDNPGYPEWGGLFAIAGDRADVRSHVESPFDPAEMVIQAVEGYPMLLSRGAFPVPFESDPTRIAPRTVVALTTDDRLLLMLIGVPGISLARLRGWLAFESDNLGIDTALNLDGGRSSGLAVRAGEVDWMSDSYVEIPVVIAVYPR